MKKKIPYFLLVVGFLSLVYFLGSLAFVRSGSDCCKAPEGIIVGIRLLEPPRTQGDLLCELADCVREGSGKPYYYIAVDFLLLALCLPVGWILLIRNRQRQTSLTS